MEFLKSLVKYDEKIGRLRFFLNGLALSFLGFLVSIVVTLLVPTKSFANATQFSPEMLPGIILSILVGLVFTALYGINTAKRFWDLIGDKQKGIWFTVGYFALFLIPLINFLVGLVGCIFLLFVPGKKEVTAE